MTSRIVYAVLLIVALAIAGHTQSVVATVEDSPQSVAKRIVVKSYASTPVENVATEATPTFTSTVTDVLRVQLPPIPHRRHHDGEFREGFFTESDNWWIGNQPYYPYYGYNPLTINGYYPPYGNPYPQMYGYGYGYGGGGYYPNSSASGIMPAPPLASPPAYIPAFTRPVPPAPMNIRITSHGIRTERDRHFQLFFVPQPPNYLTTGSAIYQIPQQYYNYYYPPYNR